MHVVIAHTFYSYLQCFNALSALHFCRVNGSAAGTRLLVEESLPSMIHEVLLTLKSSNQQSNIVKFLCV